MAIKVSRNMAYGGHLVTEKYKPLNVEYAAADKNTYSRLMTHRAELLTAAHILPQALNLYTDWTAAIAAERTTGQLPPLVVISSNRSQWIGAGVLACTSQLRHVSFTDAHDLNALTDKGLVGQAPPLYAPLRTGPNRKVYIVVHQYEYAQYKTALDGLGITVVGYHFHRPRRSPVSQLTGFGASRFAAIEFCKELRTQAGNPWNYAWLLDDNVVGITSWPGYAKFETAMTATPTKVCAGFKGGTLAEDHRDIVSWATKEVKDRRGIPTDLPRLEPKGGLVQQASLWNIAYLADNYLNFGPAFIQSAEDVSMSKYLDLTSAPYFFYEGAKVVKQSVGKRHDNSPGYKKVEAAKEAFTKWVIDAEAAGARDNTLPPPVMVKPTGGVDETLSAFITNWFTSTTPPPAENAKDASVQNKAKCQAVELMVVEALGKGFFNVDALALNLKVNGPRPQEVGRVNL